jgi:hypothetical protein
VTSCGRLSGEGKFLRRGWRRVKPPRRLNPARDLGAHPNQRLSVPQVQVHRCGWHQAPLSRGWLAAWRPEAQAQSLLLPDQRRKTAAACSCPGDPGAAAAPPHHSWPKEPGWVDAPRAPQAPAPTPSAGFELAGAQGLRAAPGARGRAGAVPCRPTAPAWARLSRCCLECISVGGQRGADRQPQQGPWRAESAPGGWQPPGRPSCRPGVRAATRAQRDHGGGLVAYPSTERWRTGGSPQRHRLRAQLAWKRTGGIWGSRAGCSTAGRGHRSAVRTAQQPTCATGVAARAANTSGADMQPRLTD